MNSFNEYLPGTYSLPGLDSPTLWEPLVQWGRQTKGQKVTPSVTGTVGPEESLSGWRGREVTWFG